MSFSLVGYGGVQFSKVKFIYMEQDFVYYAYSTKEQRDSGLEALKKCLIKDGYIKISEEIEFTEIPNQNNNDKETKTSDL